MKISALKQLLSVLTPVCLSRSPISAICRKLSIFFVASIISWPLFSQGQNLRDVPESDRFRVLSYYLDALKFDLKTGKIITGDQAFIQQAIADEATMNRELWRQTYQHWEKIYRDNIQERDFTLAQQAVKKMIWVHQMLNSTQQIINIIPLTTEQPRDHQVFQWAVSLSLKHLHPMAALLIFSNYYSTLPLSSLNSHSYVSLIRDVPVNSPAAATFWDHIQWDLPNLSEEFKASYVYEISTSAAEIAPPKIADLIADMFHTGKIPEVAHQRTRLFFAKRAHLEVALLPEVRSWIENKKISYHDRAEIVDGLFYGLGDNGPLSHSKELAETAIKIIQSENTQESPTMKAEAGRYGSLRTIRGWTFGWLVHQYEHLTPDQQVTLRTSLENEPGEVSRNAGYYRVKGNSMARPFITPASWGVVGLGRAVRACYRVIMSHY